jgi:hypothetical protein
MEGRKVMEEEGGKEYGGRKDRVIEGERRKECEGR